MDLIKNFKAKAADDPQIIVLPEGGDERVISAAEQIKKENFAVPIVLGTAEEVAAAAEKSGSDLSGIEVINPKYSDLKEKFTDEFFEIRKHKGISKKDAENAVLDPLYFGTMMIYTGAADGMVAGAANATGNVLRPAFQIVKTKEGISVVSSVFIMVVNDKSYGEDGVILFADCAVNPNPDAEQLSEIAVSTAETAEKLLGFEPKVAMLSFSTRGSAKHEFVDKVKKAVELAQKQAPDIDIDGEMQADAALVPSVAERKAPDSSVSGKANVLIFPDLQSGNIGYKLVQRLAGAQAVGPVMQGLAKPINDLSRGCSVEDIVNLAAITSVQAQK
ncbi:MULTISPECIES: phosphate acetyltransferase [unclassified Halanaerobium]|uniref:phosphate acetyltransferase n=1 Tax=unclassified Halanaerobium TaxID=2641197 RepID=UPI000DF21335|nr:MULTISPECIES: phosphate acetyltransferase [unclassified Halanaerobium]RCW51446.1 phosphate acetyltransferase [Halanaerobium sp. MA284_MarDTE_T2]RCW89234.1 phosphate acetyltransferase [Halanaerobium sp. DL-01]